MAGTDSVDRATRIARRLRANPLLVAAFAAALGILIADAHPARGLFLCLALASGAASWLCRRLTPNGTLALPLLGIAATLTFATIHAWHLQALKVFPGAPHIQDDPQGIHVSASGRVIQEPRDAGFRTQQAVFQLATIRLGEAAPVRCSHRVLVRVENRSVRYGEVLQFSGRLFLPEAPRNPGEFNYRQYIQRNDWVGIIGIGEAEACEAFDHQPHRLKVLASQAREHLATAITRDLEGHQEVCAILTAMVLGMRENASPELEAPFRLSGTLHLFAVSGLHVGIFAFIAYLLLKPFGLRRSRVALALIPLLFFYAFLTGWRPSAIRAATMAAIFLAGYGIHREPRLLNSLGLAALLILASNSNQLFRPGFQLSFAVLLAIVTLSGPLLKPFQRWLHPDPFIPPSLVPAHLQRAYSFRRWVANLFTVSAAAWIGSLPFMICTFHLVTPIALVANCFLMPFGFFILFTAALSMLCSLVGVLGWANILFNNANFALVHALLGLAEFFSGIPGAHAHVSTRPSFSRPPLEVTVLDLPRGGACTHIQLRRGRHELIDCGHRYHYPRVVEPYLKWAGINRLDRLFLTHGDTAHSGAAPELLSQFAPRVYHPLWPSRSPSLREAGRQLQARGSATQTLHAPSSMPLGARAHWEILYPPQDDTFAPATADERGLVLRLHYENWRLLFLADAGFHTERWLVDAEIDLQADVLIRGQHETDLSGLQPFLDQVAPTILVWDSESLTETEPPKTPAWLAPAHCHVIDQAGAGAVILALTPNRIEARGFRNPQVFTVNRAR